MRLRPCIIGLSVACVLLLPSAPAFAQEKSALEEQLGAFAGEQGANVGAPADPRIVVANVIRVMLTLVGVLFLAYTVYAGYLIMTAAGDEEKVNKGKSTLRTAVIGVIVTLAAYSMTIFVTRSLLRATQGGAGFESGVQVTPGGAVPPSRDPLAAPPPNFTPTF